MLYTISPITANLPTLISSYDAALAAYAAQLEYPMGAVINMAIAGFLDEDALTCADSKPITSSGKLIMLAPSD